MSSINFEQRRRIMNSFVICLFSYCPVVWMSHSRKLNVRVNRLHERALRVVYRDFDTSFEELLRRDSSTNLHQRTLQKLMTEIFRVYTGTAPELMQVVLNFLMYLINGAICLIVTLAYHVLEGMALKQHLLQVQNYGEKFL